MGTSRSVTVAAVRVNLEVFTRTREEILPPFFAERLLSSISTNGTETEVIAGNTNVISHVSIVSHAVHDRLYVIETRDV